MEKNENIRNPPFPFSETVTELPDENWDLDFN